VDADEHAPVEAQGVERAVDVHGVTADAQHPGARGDDDPGDDGEATGVVQPRQA
jgi:hypothetical protein